MVWKTEIGREGGRGERMRERDGRQGEGGREGEGGNVKVGNQMAIYIFFLQVLDIFMNKTHWKS